MPADGVLKLKRLLVCFPGAVHRAWASLMARATGWQVVPYWNDVSAIKAASAAALPKHVPTYMW